MPFVIEYTDDVYNIASTPGDTPEQLRTERTAYWTQFEAQISTLSVLDQQHPALKTGRWWAADVLARITSGESLTLTREGICREMGL